MKGSNFKKGLIISCWRLIGIITNFLLPIFLARSLAPDHYGAYKFLFLIQSILLIIIPMGLDSSLIYFISKNPDKHQLYSFNTIIASLLSSVAVCLFLVPFRLDISSFFNQPYFSETAISFSTFLISSAMVYHIGVYLIYLGKERYAISYEVITQIVRVTCIIFTLIISKSLSQMFYNLTIMQTMVLVILLSFHLQYILKHRINMDEIRKTAFAQCRYGLPLAMSQLLFF